MSAFANLCILFVGGESESLLFSLFLYDLVNLGQSQLCGEQRGVAGHRDPRSPSITILNLQHYPTYRHPRGGHTVSFSALVIFNM